MKNSKAILLYNRIQRQSYIYLLCCYLLAISPFALLYIFLGGFGHTGNLVLTCVWLPFVFTSAAFARSRYAGFVVLAGFSLIQTFILIEYPGDPMMELARQLPTMSYKKILMGIFFASLIILFEPLISRKTKEAFDI